MSASKNIMKPKIYLHKGDLPHSFKPGPIIAIDTETMGLNLSRDRLCLVQISNGDNTAHLVQIIPNKAPENLVEILNTQQIVKLFHFARFDISVIYRFFSLEIQNIYCTKIASRLCRTYTDKHSLKELCREMLGVDLNKQEQSSDWGSDDLRPTQLEYAANDVLYLHALKEKLDIMLKRENRMDIAQQCFSFVIQRAKLDAQGFENIDIFSHS